MERLDLMCCRSSLSENVMISLGAMGQITFRQHTGDFSGAEMIVVDLKHVETTREMLKMSLKTSANCLAHAMMTYAGILSRLAAF